MCLDVFALLRGLLAVFADDLDQANDVVVQSVKFPAEGWEIVATFADQAMRTSS